MNRVYKKVLAREVLFLSFYAIVYISATVYSDTKRFAYRMEVQKNGASIKALQVDIDDIELTVIKEGTKMYENLEVKGGQPKKENDSKLLDLKDMRHLIEELELQNHRLNKKIDLLSDNRIEGYLIVLAIILFPLRYWILIMIWAIKTIRAKQI